jgi:hypothetical protein
MLDALPDEPRPPIAFELIELCWRAHLTAQRLAPGPERTSLMQRLSAAAWAVAVAGDEQAVQ